MGGSWGIFATSFESKNGEFGLVKGHDSVNLEVEFAMRFMGFSGIVFVEIRILFVVLCNDKV